MYRVRALDHERGIASPWGEVLAVTTNRSPYTIQDVLVRINANDIKVTRPLRPTIRPHDDEMIV